MKHMQKYVDSVMKMKEKSNIFHGNVFTNRIFCNQNYGMFIVQKDRIKSK